MADQIDGEAAGTSKIPMLVTRLPERLDKVKNMLLQHISKSTHYFKEELGPHEEVIENELGKTQSPLKFWAEEDVRQLPKRKALDRFAEKLDKFPLLAVADEITETLRKTDVVLVIAPTGSGKSIMAPYLAEQLLLSENGQKKEFYRKTLMVVPSAEHCGSTVRSIDKFYPHSGLIVDGYINSHENVLRHIPPRNPMRNDFVEFICTNYNSALRILPTSKLNLLVLDEVHETNDNVQVTLAMALKMLTGAEFVEKKKLHKPERMLNRLLLMSATVDEKERWRYEKYFTSKGISFKCIDFSSRVRPKRSITMSCYSSPAMPQGFVQTEMSEEITAVSSRRVENNNAELEYPEPKFCVSRVQTALEVAMGKAVANLRERWTKQGRGRRAYDMQSIIVILPGLAEIDELYSTVYHLRNFRFTLDDEERKYQGFHPLRLTSLVHDDARVTEEIENEGGWMAGSRQGRILLTTNYVASGLTVPNAAFVIDAGMQKVPSEYRMYGLRGLETTWIDQQMMLQRAGRTGRTTNGEYFLPYSAERVKKMKETSRLEMMINRNYDEKHFLMCSYFRLNLLHPPPDKLTRELRRSMEIRGLVSSTEGTFKRDSIMLYNMMPFLPIELARFVIQGTRLGITAHVVYLAAEMMSRLKFLQNPSKGRSQLGGPSEKRSALEIYAKRMDSIGPLPGMPPPYRGAGDSVALADFLVSFHWLVRDDCVSETAMNRVLCPATSFWGGAWRTDGFSGVKRDERNNIIRQTPLFDLYTLFVREEGRDALVRHVVQIRSALKTLDLLRVHRTDSPRAKTNIWHTRLNRHLASSDSYCLNEKGRALLGALLTMHSSRIGVWEGEKTPAYYVYDEESIRSDAHLVQYIFPESEYTQSENDWNVVCNTPIYGRYTEAFKGKYRYRGAIDPITPLQMSFMLNINGDPSLAERPQEYHSEMILHLTGAPEKKGLHFVMNPSATEVINVVRHVLRRGSRMLCVSRDRDIVPLMEELLIGMWQYMSAHPEDYRGEPIERGGRGRGGYDSEEDDWRLHARPVSWDRSSYGDTESRGSDESYDSTGWMTYGETRW